MDKRRRSGRLDEFTMKKRRRQTSPNSSKDVREGIDEQELLSVSHIAAGTTGEEATSETMHITSPSSDNVITVNDFLNWSAENGGLHLKRTYKNRNGRTRYNRVILSSDADTPLPGDGETESKPTKANIGRSSRKSHLGRTPSRRATRGSSFRISRRFKSRKLEDNERCLPISAPTPLKLRNLVSTSPGSSPDRSAKKPVTDPRKVPFVVSSFNSPLRVALSDGSILSRLPQTLVKEPPLSKCTSRSTKKEPSTIKMPNVTPLKLTQLRKAKLPDNRRYERVLGLETLHILSLILDASFIESRKDVASHPPAALSTPRLPKVLVPATPSPSPPPQKLQDECPVEGEETITVDMHEILEPDSVKKTTRTLATSQSLATPREQFTIPARLACSTGSQLSRDAAPLSQILQDITISPPSLPLVSCLVEPGSQPTCSHSSQCSDEVDELLSSPLRRYPQPLLLTC
ncbi:hypothetical protein SCHPADRAFT_271908 [Schizopora paradoxa]|uniref:Uncharacterized protein n=1 Tax=Schizopora paradoxa TaxID=27342 RepID=A0A0H2RTB3_9AGAM|nr:hypothetical protein SCHPADRAFT_271908 [Schizopora paradoxa]